jgi:hypothetical protein
MASQRRLVRRLGRPRSNDRTCRCARVLVTASVPRPALLAVSSSNDLGGGRAGTAAEQAGDDVVVGNEIPERPDRFGHSGKVGMTVVEGESDVVGDKVVPESSAPFSCAG